MAAVGSPETRLIILRGDSGSGKTTTALALRERLTGATALVHQDAIRREMLAPSGRERSTDAAAIIDAIARTALDRGRTVVLDGIFNLRDYADPFERLWRDHLGRTLVYTFDVGLDETLRRHAGRPLSTVVSEADLRAWYDGWQPLTFVDEIRIPAEVGTDELVDRILADLS